MLIDRRNRSWLVFVLVAAVAASIWFFFASIQTDTWPGGSSVPGFTFGVVGGLICLFEMLLWLRKQLRTWRIGPTQTWLRAHIWLGLLSLPLLIFHSGFRLGGTLSTVLMILFLIVIASGIWGLVVQQFLPRRLLHDVPGETVYSQFDPIAEQLVKESERAIEALGGAKAPRATIHIKRGESSAEEVPGADVLREFHNVWLKPYLVGGNQIDSPLRFPAGATAQFRELRAALPPAAGEVADVMEQCCNQRRQIDEQRQLQFWLHNWLWLHLPLSVALIILMFVHIWVALKYW